MSDFDPEQFVWLAIAIFVFLIRLLSFSSKGPFPAGSREDNDVRRGRTRQGTTAGTASRIGGIGLSKLKLPDCVKKDVRFERLRRATLAGDWKTISMTLQALRGHDMRRFYVAIVAKAIEEEWQGWVPGSNECSFNHQVLLDWEKSEGENIDCRILLIEILIAMAQHIKLRCPVPALGYLMADTALTNAKFEIAKLSEAQRGDPLLRLARIHLLLTDRAVSQNVVILQREVLVPPSFLSSSSPPSGEYNTPVAHATEVEIPPSRRDCAGTDASNDAGGSVRWVGDRDEEDDPPIVHATIV